MGLGIVKKCDELGIKRKDDGCGKRVNDRDKMKQIQEYYDVNFEDDYVEFLVEIKEVEESKVYGITGIEGEYIDIFKMYTIDEVMSEKEEYNDRIPKVVFPISETHSGDLIVLDTSTVGVYYWNHEGEYLAVNFMVDEGGVDEYREIWR